MKKIRTKDFSRICFYLRPWYIDGLKSKAGKTIMIAVDFGIHDTIDDGKVKATMIKILDLILQTTVKSDKVSDKFNFNLIFSDCLPSTAPKIK